MSKVITALKLLLADAAQLQVPGIASTVAGVVVAVLGMLGYDFPLGVVLAWVTMAGTVAGIVEKIVTGKASPAPAPPAPVPPVPPVPPAPAKTRQRDAGS